MLRCLHRALFAALLIPTVGAQTSTLRATLDLRPALAQGWLDAGDPVGLRGSVAPLSWGSTLAASDPEGDSLYTLDVVFEARDSVRVELKIKADVVGAPNDGWQEGANHVVTLAPGAVTEWTLAWTDRSALPPGVVTGTVETLTGIEGAGLAARDVHVWLPPGYAASDRRYPVLYLHDGAGMFGTEPGSEWGMDEAAQALVEAGEIEPLVIVAVANSDRRTDEYTPTAHGWEQTVTRRSPPTADGDLGALTGTYDAGPDSIVVVLRDGVLLMDPPDAEAWVPLSPQDDGSYAIPDTDVTLHPVRQPSGAVDAVVARRPTSGGLGDAYGEFLVGTVKPMIDARYRTLTDAAHTGLGGSSLGGLITMHLGITHADVFGRLLVASPSVWWDDKVILQTVAQATPSPGQRIWVDIGTGEGGSMVPDARRLAEVLVETGWDAALVRYVEAEGAGHEASAWQARAPDMLRFLFPPE